LATQSNPLPSPAVAPPARPQTQPAVAQTPALLPGAAPRRSYFNTSLGTKVLMGATGLLLFAYLILHLAGNLLLYFGPETFNGYSHLLISNPLVIPVEIGLLAVFIVHVYKAVTNFLANRRARPVGYRSYTWTKRPSRKSLASTTMILSGIVLFVFILIHLVQFKFGVEYDTTDATGAEVRDLYRLEVEVFGNLLNVVFYVFAMVVVGAHLWHGVASAFDSLGATHPRYTPWVLGAGKTLAFLIAMGFVTIPVAVFFVLAPMAAGSSGGG
jgi:succinate dehydrogenase / fumarate reductase cytochrome b subunit